MSGFEERLRLLMPRHDCGRRLEPGALGGQPMLVCVPCAYIEEPDPDWVDAVVVDAKGPATGGTP